MTMNDYIGLGTLGIAMLTLFGGIVSWLIGRYEKVQQDLHKAEKTQILDAIANLSKAQDQITERLVHWENVQTNQIHSSMKQFAVMESAIRDYSKDVTALNHRCTEMTKENEHQFRIVWSEVQKIYKSFTEEIAPGVFRVSEKKK